MKTRIAVNLLWCITGRVGGSEEYLVRQLLGLQQHRDELDVTLHVPRGFVAAHPELCSVYPVRVAPSTCNRRSVRVALENSWLVRATAGADIVHHGGGTIPGRGARRTLLTVHDVQYLTYPEYFSWPKLAYLRSRVPSSIDRATLVAVPSSFVKQTLIDNFGKSEDDIVVVRHGMPPTLGRNPTSADELRRKFDLGGARVVVYPAVRYPHKNHRFLLHLLATSWRDVVLVCAGSAGLAEDEVRTLARRLGVADRVRLVGRVTDDDRDGLLALAEAMVFPSLYEGFGAPLVEAMSLGVPVIASDRTAVPEVVGDAGLVLPLDEASWGGALDVVRDRRASLVAAGRSRAAGYSIAESGAELADAYSRCMARNVR